MEANGIPLGAIAAPANRHDSPLLVPTLDTLAGMGPLAGPVTVHLHRRYNSPLMCEQLAVCRLRAEIAERGKPAPQAAQRWVVERTNA